MKQALEMLSWILLKTGSQVKVGLPQWNSASVPGVTKDCLVRTVMWATLAVEVALILGRASPVSVTATQGSVTQIPDAAGIVNTTLMEKAVKDVPPVSMVMPQEGHPVIASHVLAL